MFGAVPLPARQNSTPSIRPALTPLTHTHHTHHTPTKQQRMAAFACLALSMALVGSYVALSKPLVAALPVFLLAWMRFGIGGVAMLHWLQKPPHEPALDRRTQGLVFLESFLGNFLFSICMLYGVSLTSAVTAGVVMAAIPATVAMMSWLFLHERITPRIAVAIACAVLGIGLFSLSTSEHHSITQSAEMAVSVVHQWLGHALLIAAVLCEAAYAVIGKKLTASLTPRRISALINAWGFVLVTPMGIWYAWTFDFTAITANTWALLVFYALAASVWTVWLWMTGLRSVPASQAGVFTVMLPLSAAGVGVVVLGETLSGAQLLAFGIALLGLVLATLPERRNTSQQR
jgi:drug/metabolite transporter (DMT)-like permease